MKKYNVMYAKKSACLILGISFFISLVFFIVALFADVLEYDIIVSIVSFSIGLLIWAINLFRISFAVRLCRVQERELNVLFDDRGAELISPSSHIFLSDCWFIASGKLYLHRDFIKKITVKIKKSSMGNNYYCVFSCVSGNYTLYVDSSATAKKIKQWK